PSLLFYHSFVFILLPYLLISTLFPYTTLFRSIVFRAFRETTDRRYLKKQYSALWRAPSLYFVQHPDRYFPQAQTDEFANPWLGTDRKSTRLNSSHVSISYAVFCLKKKKHTTYY